MTSHDDQHDSFVGRALIGDAGCVVAIGDTEESGWLGQVTTDLSASGAEPGAVTVTLLDGDRAGFTAEAFMDVAGALRGERAFEPPNPK